MTVASKNIKMIITDLDGTLLRADKTISEYTKKVLLHCRKLGIKIAFATARTENSSKRFVSAILPDAIISNGGALARCGDATVYSCAITQETANCLLRDCVESPDVGYITVETVKGDYFVNHPFDPNSFVWRDYRHGKHNDFLQGVGCDVYKLAVEFYDTKSAYQIAANYPDIGMIGYTGENWFSFHHKDVTKWNAINHLIEYMGISVNEVAAFGDDYNDIDMLQKCGIGVAVANAIDEVKSVANYICGTNDNDGIAKWIEQYIIQN